MTSLLSSQIDVLQDFNSHTREGVTCRLLVRLLVGVYFNSHTREGVTYIACRDMHTAQHFNSHTREGVTVTKWDSVKLFNFNSHTREGVTHTRNLIKHIVLLFQLTHP